MSAIVKGVANKVRALKRDTINPMPEHRSI
jgi:hypothetical protein